MEYKTFLLEAKNTIFRVVLNFCASCVKYIVVSHLNAKQMLLYELQ